MDEIWVLFVRTVIVTGVPLLFAGLVKILTSVNKAINQNSLQLAQNEEQRKLIKQQAKALKKHMNREEAKGQIQDDRLNHVETQTAANSSKLVQIEDKIDEIIHLLPKRSEDASTFN